VSYSSTQRHVRRKKEKQAVKRNALKSSTAKWRSEPATDRQRKVLRKITAETGQKFAPDITRGQASEAITRRFDENELAAAHARRARRRRRSEGGRRAVA